MSKEYIEREAALEKVIEVKHHDPELSGVVLHRYIKEIDLKDIPAADVVPVAHGELTEHIRELLRAEQDGRLVVPPCKIGATVYRFQRYFNDATLKSEIKIKPCVVESVSTKCIITTDHVVMLFSDFGKTVFLTREEAEKALKGNAERTEEQ